MTIGRRKAIALLAYLAVEADSHSRDSLAALFWPEYDQSSARADLRRTLSLLRRTLGEKWLVADRETAGLNWAPWVASEQGQRESSRQSLWLDVNQFRELLAACDAHGHPPQETCADCLPLLEEAAELYQGDFLAGFTLRDSPAFDEWQFFQAEGLRDALAGVLERTVRWLSDRDDHEAAISSARRWLALNPLHEPAHICLMDLYSRTGRRTAALRQYETCRQMLADELRVQPVAETRRLYEEIRDGQIGTQRPLVGPRAAQPGEGLPSAPVLTPEDVPYPDTTVFVARERELAWLSGSLTAAVAGKAGFAFIAGGPGRGKTALMRVFARRAMDAHPDLLAAWGNCNAYSGVGDPYLPFREVLAALTGDVTGTLSRQHARRLWSAFSLAVQTLLDNGPNLIDSLVPGPPLLARARAAASAGDADWVRELQARVGQGSGQVRDLEQRALFVQVANSLRALAVKNPLLLVLDDLQWADAGSVSLLLHLGRQLADKGGKILIVGAYRPEELAAQHLVTHGSGQPEHHPLDQVLAEIQRHFGDVGLDLARVGEAENSRLVDGLLDAEPNRLGEDFRGSLARRTEGHPLFAVEVIRSMQESGQLVRGTDGAWMEGADLDWSGVPARVGAVIKARLGRLDERQRELLSVASVEGETFTAHVVARVLDVPEREILRALTQLLGAFHRLVREAGEERVGGSFLSRYRFTHALFQEYLYGELSLGERRLLHGQVAAALEDLYGDQAAVVAVQLAGHYDRAGLVDKAAEYLVQAGELAQRAYANEEAQAQYQRALALLDASPVGDAHEDWRLRALIGLGQIGYARADYATAEGRLREAITLGQEIGAPTRELVRLYWWLGDTLILQWRSDEVIACSESGLALLGEREESGSSLDV